MLGKKEATLLISSYVKDGKIDYDDLESCLDTLYEELQ